MDASVDCEVCDVICTITYTEDGRGGILPGDFKENRWVIGQLSIWFIHVYEKIKKVSKLHKCILRNVIQLDQEPNI